MMMRQNSAADSKPMPKFSPRILQTIDELIEQYQDDDRYNRPWIIGFSGRKDSTVPLLDFRNKLVKNRNEQNTM
jgi:DNA sulfur modification protein DndC